LDTRTDLFSFGAVLYEMSTGTLPFRGESSGVIFHAILERNPISPVRVNPDLPPKLEDIVNKALEKDRDLRYQHAAELRGDLQWLKRDTDSGRTRKLTEALQSSPEANAHRKASRPSGSIGPHLSGSSPVIEVARQHKFGLSAAIVIVLAVIAGTLESPHGGGSPLACIPLLCTANPIWPHMMASRRPPSFRKSSTTAAGVELPDRRISASGFGACQRSGVAYLARCRRRVRAHAAYKKFLAENYPRPADEFTGCRAPRDKDDSGFDILD
jgi:serine/threonine protein kinase